MMTEAQNTKKVLLTPPQLKDDGDLAGNTYVDTKGFGYIEFLIITGTTDIALGSTAETAALKIEHCDTSDGSYTDVSGAAVMPQSTVMIRSIPSSCALSIAFFERP